MLIAVAKEMHAGETRVAATPETVKKLIAAGMDVRIEKDAGSAAFFSDGDYAEAGASIVADAAAAYEGADVILKVRAPQADELGRMPRDAALIAMFSPFTNPLIMDYARHGLTCLAMELIPRISRAQGMDALSSQANIGGYRAVLLAAQYFQRFFPMLMTAAGTVTPAKVLVLGAGVAGLQAIATARRLGAVVEAFDVRAAAREQVQSLGAKFVEVAAAEEGEAAGGYAREMSEEYKRKQRELVHKHAASADIIITTALIPGRPAPKLISEAMVKEMKAGSVIVDMAVEMGGNCELSELDKVVVKHGVTLIGVSNIPALMAADASRMYARNLYHFLLPMLPAEGSGGLVINREDEVIEAALLCQHGELLKAQFAQGGST